MSPIAFKNSDLPVRRLITADGKMPQAMFV